MACINSLQGLKAGGAFGVGVVSCFFWGGTGCFFFFGEKRPGNILGIQLFDPGGWFLKTLLLVCVCRVSLVGFCCVFLKIEKHKKQTGKTRRDKKNK